MPGDSGFVIFDFSPMPSLPFVSACRARSSPLPSHRPSTMPACGCSHTVPSSVLFPPLLFCGSVCSPCPSQDDRPSPRPLAHLLPPACERISPNNLGVILLGYVITWPASLLVGWSSWSVLRLLPTGDKVTSLIMSVVAGCERPCHSIQRAISETVPHRTKTSQHIAKHVVTLLLCKLLSRFLLPRHSAVAVE